MATRKVTVELAPGVSSWAHGDGDAVLTAGQLHEVDVTGKAELREALAAAVAAGALRLIEGDLPDAVESQEDSEAKQSAADEACAPLYAERDRELNRLSRRELTDEEIAQLAQSEEAVAVATDPAVFRGRREYVELAAERGSEYHRALLLWERRMGYVAQAALDPDLASEAKALGGPEEAPDWEKFELAAEKRIRATE